MASMKIMYSKNCISKNVVIKFPGNNEIGTAIDAAVNSRKKAKKIGVALMFSPHLYFWFWLLLIYILNLDT